MNALPYPSSVLRFCPALWLGLLLGCAAPVHLRQAAAPRPLTPTARPLPSTARPLGEPCIVSPRIFGARTEAHRLLLVAPISADLSLSGSLEEVLRQAFREQGRSPAWAQAGAPQVVHIASVRCYADNEGAAWALGLATFADTVLWAQARPPAGRQPGWLYLHLTAVAVLGGRTIHLPPIAFWPAPATPAVRQATSNGPIGPGPFTPGGQPVPCYIGNTVHRAIAEFYRRVHLGDDVYANDFPISGILHRLRITPAAGASRAALLAKPDITNMTRRHLYEIKPAQLAAQGLIEAMLYQTYFQQVGVPMALGPISEPGTVGIVPAPGGYAVFSVATPGVIVYSCGRGAYQPAAVRVPSSGRDPNLIPREISVDISPLPPRSWQWDDWIALMRDLTGLTGIGLMTYMVFSVGTRIVFPVRNFVPAP